MTLDPRTPVIIGVGQYNQRSAGIEDALKVEHTEPGQPHDLTEAEIARLMSFVRAN